MKVSIIILLLLSTLQGCNKEFSSDIDIENPTKEEDCTGDFLCFEYDVLKPIQIRLTKRNGEPADIQEFRVFFTETGEDVETLTDHALSSDLSRFEIAHTMMFDEIDFEGTSITFEAKLSRLRTWKGEFIVAKDCCHVFSPEGQELEFTL